MAADMLVCLPGACSTTFSCPDCCRPNRLFQLYPIFRGDCRWGGSAQEDLVDVGPGEEDPSSETSLMAVVLTVDLRISVV